MESRRKINKLSTFSFPVTFDGGLLSTVRAELINELIKYTLYERQQIPLPFEQVKTEVKKALSQKVAVTHQGKQTFSRQSVRKAKDAVKKLEEIFVQVKHAFEVCPEIKQAVIILGATTVTPKEVYVVKLPPLNPEAENLGAKRCIKSLVKQLVVQDPMGNIKQITSTNMTLLLQAPRQSSLHWFYPKPAYKLTNRGLQFHFCFTCNHGNSEVTGSHNLSAGFSFIDLSGFEPLESSDTEMPVDDLSDCAILSYPSSATGSISSEYVCIDSDHDIEIIDSSCDTTTDTTPINESSTGSMTHSFDTTQCCQASGQSSQEDMQCESGGIPPSEDYIWFQSPVLVKGYKDKLSREATFGGFL